MASAGRRWRHSPDQTCSRYVYTGTYFELRSTDLWASDLERVPETSAVQICRYDDCRPTLFQRGEGRAFTFQEFYSRLKSVKELYGVKDQRGGATSGATQEYYARREGISVPMSVEFEELKKIREGVNEDDTTMVEFSGEPLRTDACRMTHSPFANYPPGKLWDYFSSCCSSNCMHRLKLAGIPKVTIPGLFGDIQEFADLAVWKQDVIWAFLFLTYMSFTHVISGTFSKCCLCLNTFC